MLNKESIDFKKLHKALSDTYKRQMEIKKKFPHRFEWPPYDSLGGDEYIREAEKRRPWRLAREEFDRLSSLMTVLCCVLNHAKGKLHMHQYCGEEFTLQDQEEFIQDHYQDFLLEEEKIAV